MENQKPVESMSRFEVIKDLARWAHPTWYHSLLSWSTPRLKALLVFYREDAKEGSRSSAPQIRGIAIAKIELVDEITPRIGNEIRRA